jgi:hypothetical protein
MKGAEKYLVVNSRIQDYAKVVPTHISFTDARGRA